jgi:hypothetical protein
VAAAARCGLPPELQERMSNFKEGRSVCGASFFARSIERLASEAHAAIPAHAFCHSEARPFEKRTSSNW